MASSPLKNKEIVLGITGSIAAYKACDVVRRLREAGAGVSCVLTRAGAHFITPLTLAALSARPVHQDMMDPASWNMSHLELAKKADAVLVAPCSADTLSRLAAGRAEELLDALVLATRAPVFLAPAMHEPMWTHAATRAHVKTLAHYGYRFIGPVEGSFASGESGLGRMESPDNIVGQLVRFFAKRGQ